jgi:hypothetical protein
MLFKRVLTFIITLLILFADSGQTIYAHTCFKSKQTHYSIVSNKHCCGQVTKVAGCVIKKSACCEVNSKYLKANFINNATEVNHPVSVPAVAVAKSIVDFSIPLIPAFSFVKPQSDYVFPVSAGSFTHTFRI